MSVNVVVLGSGSGGNSVIVHDGINGVMVDVGFSYGEMISRMNQAGVDPGMIRLICVTHAHVDHVRRVVELAENLDVPVYISAGTYKIASWLHPLSERVRLFVGGNSFESFSFLIQSFDVSHDIGAPVGFTINFNGRRIAVAMDLGIVDDAVVAGMQNADVMLLESNHDLRMLADSLRTEELKDRIRGEKGHLSNEQCSNALKQMVGPGTSQVVLCHLSDKCNTPELAMISAKTVLKKHPDVKIAVASHLEKVFYSCIFLYISLWTSSYSLCISLYELF
jgi:phosphoribosyl 1,2-cyclic phosphodiesterase